MGIKSSQNLHQIIPKSAKKQHKIDAQNQPSTTPHGTPGCLSCNSFKGNLSEIQAQNPARIGPRLAKKSAQNQTKIDFKINQNQHKNVFKIGPKLASKLAQESPQNHPKIISEFAQNCLQNHPKIVSKSGVGVGGRGPPAALQAFYFVIEF
jgi:hypothetical protein